MTNDQWDGRATWVSPASVMASLGRDPIMPAPAWSPRDLSPGTVAPLPISTAVVSRLWTLADIKEVAEGLPNMEEVGGTEYSRLIGELVGQYCPSTAEFRRLLMTQMGLKWGRVESSFLSED